MNEITKTATIKIVTSGYSDRFVSIDAKYHYGNAKFTSRDHLVHFLVDELNQTWDTAWAATNVKTQYSIAGETGRGYMQTSISGKQVAELSEFLVNGHRNVDDLGFGEHITAIMQNQLSECDRINLQKWGHVNGQERK